MSNFGMPPLSGSDHSQGLLRALGMQDPARLLPKSPIEGGSVQPQDGAPVAGAPPSSSFEGLLTDSIARVDDLQDDVRRKVRGMALGEDVELHDVMIAASKSEVAFNLLLEVRNKLVDAWEKLSRSAV